MNALEKTVESVCSGWWSDKRMHMEVWAGLLAVRTAYYNLGYSTHTPEYNDLTFLLSIHHELMKAENNG